MNKGWLGRAIGLSEVKEIFSSKRSKYGNWNGSIHSSPIIVSFSLRFFFPSFFIPSAIPLNIHRDRND